MASIAVECLTLNKVRSMAEKLPLERAAKMAGLPVEKVRTLHRLGKLVGATTTPGGVAVIAVEELQRYAVKKGKTAAKRQVKKAIRGNSSRSSRSRR